MAYATLAELKSAMRITDSVDDTLLTQALDAATEFIDVYCERSFGTASGTASRDYAPSGMWEPLMIDDATSIVSVKIDEDLDGSFGTTLAAIDYQAEPVGARNAGRTWPYTRLIPLEDGWWPIDGPRRNSRATVRVEATYGWPDVPPTIKQANILQASRLFTRFDSPLGVAGFGDLGVMRVTRSVDADVAQLLRAYRRISMF